MMDFTRSRAAAVAAVMVATVVVAVSVAAVVVSAVMAVDAVVAVVVIAGVSPRVLAGKKARVSNPGLIVSGMGAHRVDLVSHLWLTRVFVVVHFMVLTAFPI